MATYTSLQMRNSGSKGEALSGAKTFTITNAKASNDQYPVGYLTLEGNATANQNLQTSAALKGTFASFTGNMNIDSLVTSSTHFSVSVGKNGSGGSFQYTPTSAVGANSYYIKATGNFSLVIS